MPAWPMIVTSRGLPSRAVAWKLLLEQPQLLVAAHERRLERAVAPLTAAAGDDGDGAPGAHGRLLALELPGSPTSSNAIAPAAARCVDSPTSTVPGSAADWSATRC